MVFVCLFICMNLRKIYGKKEPASHEVWLSTSVPFFPPHHFLSEQSTASCQALCHLHVLFFLAYRGLLCSRPFVVGDPGPQTTSNASVTSGPAAPTLASWLCPSSSPPTPALLGVAYYLKHSCVSSGLNSYALLSFHAGLL